MAWLPSADQLLALVALINAIGGVVALIIHALRVPYRGSAASEQVAAIDAVTRQQVQRSHQNAPPLPQEKPPGPQP